MGQVPYLDVAATLNPVVGRLSMFILTRDLTKTHPVEIIWQDWTPSKALSSTTLTGGDLKASNSFDVPQRVAPQAADKPSTTGGRTRLELPARSYSVFQWEV